MGGASRGVLRADSVKFRTTQMFSAGYLAKTAVECGFLEKLLRMEAQTPFLQLVIDGNKCQQSAGDACLVQALCAGKGQGK